MKTLLTLIPAALLASCTTQTVTDSAGNTVTTKSLDAEAAALAREAVGAYLRREDRERQHELEVARINADK